MGSSAPATKPCKRCSAPILWSRGPYGWVPLDPTTAREHVVDERGVITFDARLGHRAHTCAGRMPNEGDTDDVPRKAPLEELHDELLVIRAQVDAAIKLVDQMRSSRG
jgi:hypothetical protein